MASQADLDKVGREAFEMIEEFLGRRGKKEPMLDTIQVAKQFGGVLLFVRYARHRIHRRNYVRLN